MNYPRVEAMIERSRHNTLSIFIISQNYYELLKKTIRVNVKIYHKFELSNFRDVQNLYQDKTSMFMYVHINSLISESFYIL